MRVLVVDDDPVLAELLRRRLLQAGHDAEVATSGEEGLSRAEIALHDVMVLDLLLPDLDGVEVARRLRTDGNPIPILMLTARNELQDRLRGFNAGVDDYLPKPFAIEEMLARLRAIRRRGTAALEDDRLAVGDLVLDRRAHEVTRAGRVVDLTPKEFALLEYLMEHPGQALSRKQILDRVWDYSFGSYANVVDATMRRLRRAVDQDHDRPLIHTVRGVGYKIKAD